MTEKWGKMGKLLSESGRLEKWMFSGGFRGEGPEGVTGVIPPPPSGNPVSAPDVPLPSSVLLVFFGQVYNF